jgi:2,3-bisphosphoglycerate-dependent phosphoglycerate mutase
LQTNIAKQKLISSMVHKIILVRHGESEWNKANRFTGWEDVSLSPKGIEEAIEAGKLLKEKNLIPDFVFSSVLKRAIKTAWLMLEEMDAMYVPIEKNWRLNEKHYGMLQGLNKAETAEKYGEEQVLRWRRAFDVAPPELQKSAPNHPANLPAYKNMDAAVLPATESLKDTIERLIPYWNNRIVPEIKKNSTTMIAAHGNSLRGLVMHLKGMNTDEILAFNIPTGIPYLFELDENLKVVNDEFLIDEATLKARMDAVAAQGKSSK